MNVLTKLIKNNIHRFDIELFKEKMLKWHNKNLDLIEETEINIGHRLLNPEWDMFSD